MTTGQNNRPVLFKGDRLFCLSCGYDWATVSRDCYRGEITAAEMFKCSMKQYPYTTGDPLQCRECRGDLFDCTTGLPAIRGIDDKA